MWYRSSMEIRSVINLAEGWCSIQVRGVRYVSLFVCMEYRQNLCANLWVFKLVYQGVDYGCQ